LEFRPGMGVRGLYSYVAGQDALWRPLRSSERPVLVVDAGSFKYELCRVFFFGSRHGGDLFRLRCATSELFARLQSWGWEVVFVFEGAQPEWKADTSVQRAEEDIARADRDMRGVGEGEDCVPPMLPGSVLRACLRDAGVECIRADFEADAAVCAVARDRGGMVVSRDSDLMVMPSPGYIDMPQFFEFACEREDNLQVLEPARLWEHFRLTSIDDVAAWATLCGNDFVGFDQLTPWHETLRCDSRLTSALKGSCVPPASPGHLLRLVAEFVRGCRQREADPLTVVKERLPTKVHGALEYSVRNFYQEEFDPERSSVTLSGESLSTSLCQRWRSGELPAAMVMAARGQPLMPPTLVEEICWPSAWLLSRPLRAAAAKLLPHAVRERVRRDGSAKVVEVPLEAPALEAPLTDWPFGLERAQMSGQEEACALYFRQAVDWLQLERDCDDLPGSLVLPWAAMRYLVLLNADMDEPALEIPWPYIGAWLLQFCMGPEDRQQLVADLGLGRPDKAVCHHAAPVLTAYLAAFSSVSLLNSALGCPCEEADVCSVYDGPFLHSLLHCLEAPRDGAHPPGFELDDKGRVALHVEKLAKAVRAGGGAHPGLAGPGALDLDRFKALVAAWETCVAEVDKPLAGKVNSKKTKMTMPRPARHGKSKPDPRHHKTSAESSSFNPFAALRK